MVGPAGVVVDPAADFQVLLRSVVVENGMDDLAGRHLALNGVREADELLVDVFLHATSEHHAAQDVEGGEQGRGPMAFIVVDHCPAPAKLERQARLREIERLDLRLFVNGEDDGMGRRMHVEADDVLDLLGEGGVIGALQGAQAVRLQLVNTQMRWTVLSDRPVAWAIARPVQWVTSPGGSE